MTIEPVTDAEVVGAKVTVIVQDAPAATVVQLLVGGVLLKLPLPDAVTDVSVAVPVFVSVTFWVAAEPPTEVLGKVSPAAGVSDANPPVLPVPVSATV